MLVWNPSSVARVHPHTQYTQQQSSTDFEEDSAPNKIDMILALDDIDGMDSVIHDNLIPKAEGAKLVDIGEIPTYTESDVHDSSSASYAFPRSHVEERQRVSRKIETARRSLMKRKPKLRSL
ncbi:hypothetical protein Btru_050446 [Bulinus truncatus]|nr:hypothetical protein Btru_050446 [Bulinus truncatus]